MSNADETRRFKSTPKKETSNAVKPTTGKAFSAKKDVKAKK